MNTHGWPLALLFLWVGVYGALPGKSLDINHLLCLRRTVPRSFRQVASGSSRKKVGWVPIHCTWTVPDVMSVLSCLEGVEGYLRKRPQTKHCEAAVLHARSERVLLHALQLTGAAPASALVLSDLSSIQIRRALWTLHDCEYGVRAFSPLFLKYEAVSEESHARDAQLRRLWTEEEQASLELANDCIRIDEELPQDDAVESRGGSRI